MQNLHQQPAPVHGALHLLTSLDELDALLALDYGRYTRRKESIFWRYAAGRLSAVQASALEGRARRRLRRAFSAAGTDVNDFLRRRGLAWPLARVEPGQFADFGPGAA